jgi:hypothetical protein
LVTTLSLCSINLSCFSYSLADVAYDKDVALVQDKQSSVKLVRVGEAAYENGKWYINNEMVIPVNEILFFLLLSILGSSSSDS